MNNEHNAYYRAGETIQRDTAFDPHGDFYDAGDGETYERRLKRQSTRPKLLFGKEYEVKVADFEDGEPGWFHAKYMSSEARAMGWLWEITDYRFRRAGEVNIIDWRLPTIPKREITNQKE